MKHNNNFNFLRIFAATLVAITHSYAITGHEVFEPLHQLTNGRFYFSSLGLYIFFFTSGYLVAQSAAHSKTSFIYLQKRALRIYPALITVVLLSVFIAGPLLTTFSLKQYFTNTDTWKYLWTATGLKLRFRLPGVFENTKFFMAGFNGSLWSIKLEVEMYFVLFILMLFGIFKKIKWLLLVLTILIILLLILNVKNQYSFIIPDYKNSLLACAFLFGGIMQTGIISKKISFCLFIVSGAVLITKITGLVRLDIMIDEVIFFSLATYFIAFNKKLIIHIKYDISYGIYIYAFPLQQYFFQLKDFKQSTFANLAFSLCCSVIFALCSWIYIERPALKYKAHLSSL